MRFLRQSLGFIRTRDGRTNDVCLLGDECLSKLEFEVCADSTVPVPGHCFIRFLKAWRRFGFEVFLKAITSQGSCDTKCLVQGLFQKV